VAAPETAAARVSEPVCRDRQPLSRPPTALEIVHAQDHRAVRRVASDDRTERAGALAEAPRLVGVAAKLRGDARVRDVGPIAAADAEVRRDEPTRGRAVSRFVYLEPYERVSV
jgi:hypothetical protein